MAKPEVIIFTPTEAESRALAEGLAEAEFDGFIPRVLATGPGRDRTRAAVEATAAPLMAGRDKPLLLIGAGRCRPLAGGLLPGEMAASGAVFLKEGLVLTASEPLVQAVIDRLAAKGFRPGRLADEEAGAGRLEPGCLAADSESAGLALAAAGLSKAGTRSSPVSAEPPEHQRGSGDALPPRGPEPAWLNLRLAPDGPDQDRDDYLEALTLKLLVALSTLDRTPPPSACSSCRNPCNIFK